MPNINQWLQAKTESHREKYRELEREWSDCRHCDLHHRRSKVVHLRGIIPSPLLLIGEAPGRTENLLGAPFTGDAGRKVLDPLLRDVWRRLSLATPPDFAIANIVACMPEIDNGQYVEDPDAGKIWEENWQLRSPEKSEADACRPRLVSLIRLCEPSLIILMGNIAARDFRPIQKSGLMEELPGPTKDTYPQLLGIWHPSYILRQANAQGITPESSMEFKKTAMQITAFLKTHKDLLCPRPKRKRTSNPERKR